MLRKLLVGFAFLGLLFGMAMTDLPRPALASEEPDGDAPQSVAEGSATEEEAAAVERPPANSEETPAADGESSADEEAPASTDAPSAEEPPAQTETPAASEGADSALAEESTVEASDLDKAKASVGGGIVQVLVMNRGDEVHRVGSGFVVGAGHVLTVAHLISANRRVVVVPLATKAELLARVLRRNEGADLALLRVSGLDLAPLTFAKDGFAPGRTVLSAGVWREGKPSFLVTAAAGNVSAAFAQGSVGRHSQYSSARDFPESTLIQHNAMIPVAGYGGPLVNNCGEVVGINRSPPDASGSWLRRPQAPEAVVHALEGSAVASWLRLAGATVRQSEESCVDTQVRAEAEADAARRKAEEAKREVGRAQDDLENANTRISDLEEQIRDAERRGEEAGSLREELQRAEEDKTRKEAALERLQTEAEGLRDEAERLRTAAEESERSRIEAEKDAQKAKERFLMTLAFAVAAVVLIAIVAVAMYRRRSRQLAVAQDQATRAQRAAQRPQMESRGSGVDLPTCVLSGETGDGKSVSLKIPGSMLDDGVVIGRSPRNSTFLIDEKTLSREHAKLFADRDRLCIEDLGTTNGTKVNGRDLSPNNPVAVRDGDVLELGAVRLRVAWKS